MSKYFSFCLTCASCAVAGDFCEFKATDHCENPTPIDEVSALQLFDSLNKMSSAEIPFCVNNGICYKVAGSDDHYCSCDVRSWSGRRCELKNKGWTTQATPPPTSAGTGIVQSAPSGLHISLSPVPSPTPSPAPTGAPVAAATAALPNAEGMSAGGKFGIVLVVFGGIAFITVMAIYFHQRAYFIERVVYQGTNTRDNVFRDNHSHFAAPDSHFAPPEAHFLPPEKHSQFGPPQDRHSHYPSPPERHSNYPPPERQYPTPDGSEMEMTPTNYGENGERPNSLHRLNGLRNGGIQKHSYTPARTSEERDFANVELV